MTRAALEHADPAVAALNEQLSKAEDELTDLDAQMHEAESAYQAARRKHDAAKTRRDLLAEGLQLLTDPKVRLDPRSIQ